MRVQLYVTVVLCICICTTSIPVPSSVASKAVDGDITFNAAEAPVEEDLVPEQLSQDIDDFFHQDDLLSSQVDEQLAQVDADTLGQKEGGSTKPEPTTEKAKIAKLKKNGKKISAELKQAKAVLKKEMQKKGAVGIPKKMKTLHAKKMKPLCITEHPCP